VKVLKKDRKCATFGKENRNSSKNSYHFVSLWVEVACGEHARRARVGGAHPIAQHALNEPCKWLLVRHFEQVRGASYYSRGVERTSNKLPLRGQGRSPLKYMNCKLCISLERKVCLVEENLSTIFMETQTLLKCTNFWRQNSQKVLPCRYFGDRWLLV
jgi:hypothetical protein